MECDRRNAPVPRAVGTIRAIATIVAIGCLAACGCRVGPEFRRPCPPALPCVYEQAGETLDDPQSLNHWWMALNDPVLDRLLARAVACNLDLREAYFRVIEARAQVGFTRGGLKPPVDATAGYSRRQVSNGTNQFATPSNQLQPINIFSSGFDSRWEVDLWGRLRSIVDAAEANLDRRQDDRRDVLVTVLGDVAAAYVEIRVLQSRIVHAQRNLQTQQRVLQIAVDRHRTGLTSKLDVAQAESIVHTTAAAIPALEQQLGQTAHRLSVLLGRVPTAALLTELGPGSVPQPPAELATGMPAQLLRRRPDIRMAEADVAEQNARIGVSVAELYPQLTLLGSVSVDSKDFVDWFTSQSLAYSVGPSVRWNILAWGRIRSSIAAQEARHDQSVIRYRQSVLQAVEEVENGLLSWHKQHERGNELEFAVASAEEAQLLAEENYRQGRIPFQPVLDSQRQVLLLQDQWTQCQGDRVRALIQTYKALGGGWQSPPRFIARRNGIPVLGTAEPVSEGLPTSGPGAAKSAVPEPRP